MGEKLKFVEAAILPGANVSALCAEHGISRQTGHKWLRRYREQGYLGLSEQSRRPVSSSGTSKEMISAVLELRNRRSSWGPTKLAQILKRRFGEDAPARSTVARLLKRLGRVKQRSRSARVWTVDGRPHVEVHGPNDLWTIDFKGWWRATRGERCEPLTVRDALSRFVLAVQVVPSTTGPVVRRILEGLFRRHGVPKAIQCDNGSPWVSTRSRGGLTTLSVWLVSLGIHLIRSRVGCPQDNGGHERMHRDLSELQLNPARTRRGQQRACDRWMVDFNEVRPHDALGGKTPAEMYRVSSSTKPTPRLPTYPPGWISRRVQRGGRICVDGDTVLVGSSLTGQLIGLKYESGLRWRAHFFSVDLGLIEIASLAESGPSKDASDHSEGASVSA
jgi:transposase InsO family protein